MMSAVRGTVLMAELAFAVQLPAPKHTALVSRKNSAPRCRGPAIHPKSRTEKYTRGQSATKASPPTRRTRLFCRRQVDAVQNRYDTGQFWKFGGRYFHCCNEAN